MRASSLLVAGPVALAVAMAAPDARARDARLEFGVSFDVRDQWMRAMPPLELREPFDTPLRTIPGATLPSTGPQHFVALALDTTAIAEDRWVVPLLGMSFGWAVGSGPRVVTSVDGSIVEMRPWSADTLTLLLPGFGVRTKARRWAFAASGRMVVTWVWMNAAVANGADSSELSDQGQLFAVGFGARVDLEACRRIDPTSRACLFVSPAVYEFSGFNGGSIGLRWEWGP